MHIWVRNTENGEWVSYKNTLGELEKIPSNHHREIILYSDKLPEKITEVENFLNLILKLKIPVKNIIAATPHPSSMCVHELKNVGIKKLIITAISGGVFKQGNVFMVDEISSVVCNLLHYKADDEPTSVCGAHEDRMVLETTYIQKFCLANYSTCPHWKISETYTLEDI